jgi:3-hydroxyisobutyrate dehydrogenase-like beta-hydroxyacid dehydrogenase
MGGAIVARLAGEGLAVAAYDRDHSRSAAVGAAGGTWHHELPDVVASVDVLLTVLPDGRAVEEAMTDDVLAAARPGSTWVDMTSGDPDTTRLLAERAIAHGARLLSAPISGSPDDALRGALQLFVAGPEDALAAARPVLDPLSTLGAVRVVSEDPSDAQTIKLLVNALWFQTALATSEALLVAQRAGIDPMRAQELLTGTPGSSAFSDRYLPRFLAGDDLETFGIDGIVTELRSVRAVAGTLHTPALDVSLRQHEAALAHFGPAPGELLGVRLLEVQNERTIRPRRR